MYYCLDSEQLAKQYPPLNNSQDYYYKLQMCSSIKEALDSLINGYLIVLNVYNDDGSVGVGNNPQYTNKGCTAGYKKVVTYFDYAKAIYNISVDLNFPLIFRHIKTPCFHNEGF